MKNEQEADIFNVLQYSQFFFLFISYRTWIIIIRVCVRIFLFLIAAKENTRNKRK